MFGFAKLGDLLVFHLGEINLSGGVAGVDIKPVNFAFAFVGLVDGGIEDANRAGGDSRNLADVSADAVAAEQTNDRIVGDLPVATGIDRDARALGGWGKFFVSRCRHERVFRGANFQASNAGKIMGRCACQQENPGRCGGERWRCAGW